MSSPTPPAAASPVIAAARERFEFKGLEPGIATEQDILNTFEKGDVRDYTWDGQVVRGAREAIVRRLDSIAGHKTYGTLIDLVDGKVANITFSVKPGSTQDVVDFLVAQYGPFTRDSKYLRWTRPRGKLSVFQSEEHTQLNFTDPTLLEELQQRRKQASEDARAVARKRKENRETKTP